MVKRKFNVGRHYKNKHASTYDSIVGDYRRKMIESLKKTLSNELSSIMNLIIIIIINTIITIIIIIMIIIK